MSPHRHDVHLAIRAPRVYERPARAAQLPRVGVALEERDIDACTGEARHVSPRRPELAFELRQHHGDNVCPGEVGTARMSEHARARAVREGRASGRRDGTLNDEPRGSRWRGRKDRHVSRWSITVRKSYRRSRDHRHRQRDTQPHERDVAAPASAARGAALGLGTRPLRRLAQERVLIGHRLIGHPGIRHRRRPEGLAPR